MFLNILGQAFKKNDSINTGTGGVGRKFKDKRAAYNCIIMYFISLCSFALELPI